MAVIANLKASGLATDPNQLSLPDGSLAKASNVIMRKSDVIESRRGYRLYGDLLGSTSDRAKQLMEYRERIIRHYSNVLEFDDGSGTFTAFAGTYMEPQTGLRIKSVVSNGNFYFTTDDGVKKISAKTASEFSSASGYITDAGGIKAIDSEARLNITLGNSTGFLPADSAVAYRIVWGTKDANDNLVLGTPSARIEVYNPLLDLNIDDFMRLLNALDAINQAGSMINDGNYVDTLKVAITDSAVTLQSNIISCAQKIDEDIRYGNTTGVGVPLTISTATISSGICTITFSAGTATDYFSIGSKINLKGTSGSGFAPTTGTLNGNQEVTAVTGTTVSFLTSATGPVTVNADSIIESYEYRYITTNPTWDVVSTPATHDQLADIQNRISQIFQRLQIEPNAVISTTLSNTYIQDLVITTTATVILSITIPQNLPNSYFYQIYRSSIAQATGPAILSTDVSPNDELQLVYEAYPTPAEISAGSLEVEDVTPDAFRGANLYTNASTGEGITQANDVPPLAKDINRFKNVVFYANTKTKHRKLINLLGVQKLIDDFNLSITPKITISNGTVTNTYSFELGVAEVSSITCVADVADSLDGTYFLINSANDETEYYFWYKTSGGSSVDPALAGKTGIRVEIATGETAANVASKTRDAINSLAVNDFSAVISVSPTVIVTNVKDGVTTDATAGTTGFTVSTTTQGAGENVSSKKILLSSEASVAIAVDETARSLVKVINQNPNESVYAFYISGPQDVPGQIFLEARSLNDPKFYILANNGNTGSSFNPDISPLSSPTITAIGTGTALVTTSAAHGLVNGNQIVICNSDSTPSIDGVYEITRVNATQFTVPVTVTVAGTSAVYQLIADAESSDNEEKINRVYYSKYQQPEAVPLVNYFDIGATDKAILRIFPLRDSLFVFKEDGVYRISGNFAPFDVTLFDSSCILIAPDTVDVSNNQVYAWTTQGIQVVNESGSTVISKPINTDLQLISTYDNFKSASWGFGYESDSSYTVYTPLANEDEVGTIGYRYGITTNTWTTMDRSATCGIVFSKVDRQFLGAGDANSLEEERKSYSRYDYTDRELTSTISASSYSGVEIKLTSVEGMEAGDVLIQEQLLTVYTYNMLLKKIDNDISITVKDYFSTLKAVAGDNLRTKLTQLATKLDADPDVAFTNYSSLIGNYSGSITSNSIATASVVTTGAAHNLQTNRYVQITGVTGSNPSINNAYQVTTLSPTTFSIPETVITGGTGGTFNTLINDFIDIKACYNIIIGNLNNDTGISSSNFQQITYDTIQETIITKVDIAQKTITINKSLDYVIGPITIYKAIPCEFQYSPNTLGDPLSLKQIREAQLLFANKAFTKGVMTFSTDLLPKILEVPFNSNGNGIFGHNNFGLDFFGGAANSAPFRTIVPRNCQRCRYINVGFKHQVAREQWAIYGATLVGEITSTRSYR